MSASILTYQEQRALQLLQLQPFPEFVPPVDAGGIADLSLSQGTALLSESATSIQVPDIPQCPEPVFTGGAFSTTPAPVAPDDPVIPGLASITAPQFQGGSFFIPVAPTPPALVSAPTVRDLSPPAFTGSAFVQPAFQGTEPGTVLFPASPQAPNLATITVDPVDPAPRLIAVRPVIVTPVPPADFVKQAPLIDTLQPVVLPPSPDDTLPPAPTLEQIVLPDAPVVIIPTFDAVLVGSPADPTASFSFVQTPFTDALLDDVKAKLEFWLDDNQTGLSDAIFQAIWQRAKEREDGVAAQARDTAFEEFAARGFSLPPGALVARTNEIIQGNQNKSSSLLREQAIKQAEMEVENVRFAMTEGARLSVALLDNHLQTERLGFEIARTTVDLALQLFGAQVNRYNADVNAYRTEAEVFKTQLEGEVLKLDVFRAELDGERIKGEINTQKIANYNAQINAVLATFELFKTQLEAARFTIDSNRLLIEKFQARIEGFATEARAAAIATDIYTGKINAERLKIDTFASEVDAFEAETGAYSALVQAKSTAKGQEIDVERFKIEDFRAQVEAVRAQIDALTAELQSNTAVFDSQVRRFSSESSAEADRFGAEVNKFRGDTDAYTAQIQRDIGAAGVVVDTARVNTETFDGRVRSYNAQIDGEARRFEGEINKFEADISGFATSSQREVDTARVLVDQSNAKAAIYDSRVRGFIGQTQAESSRFGAEAQLFSARTDVFQAKNEVNIQRARVALDELVANLNYLAQLQSAAMRGNAQIAAAGIAVNNFSHVISQSESRSTSSVDSNSFSKNDSSSSSVISSFQDIFTCPCD
jgi:hypothetical protein